MRIVVGMSGGVDSAVSALLLKRQGYDVVAVYMNNWEELDDQGVCTAQQDWEDVRSTCDVIGVPYYAVNFSKEYMDRVFREFLSEYQKGRTPNPDVLCNREIKFKAFLSFALQLEGDMLATGHYARTNAQGHLLKGLDAGKEQSYFLYMLKERQLKKVLFPVGGLQKREVRRLAREANLPIKDKKDSTGICFIGERNFRKFLSQYLPDSPGAMRTPEGEQVGSHIGLMHYTIGQRKGLGIGGRGDGRSFFVVDKDLERNELIVAQGEDHPLLFSHEAQLEALTWVGAPPCLEGEEVALRAKFRYRQPDQDVRLTWNQKEAHLRFEQPQRAITPGQSAVFYQGDRCLGGGIIRHSIRNH